MQEMEGPDRKKLIYSATNRRKFISSYENRLPNIDETS
jgi:hypothetical protein